MATAAHSLSSRFIWAGYLLGFSLAGFFDGILLHQILQWHHLLSGVEGSAFRDLRVQILADGAFHLLMYVVAAGGLYLLWRSRREFAQRGADRALFAAALIGFGVWHIIDAALFHWALGLHRIRMDAENLLLWDILWLVPFGIVPLVAGLWLRRARGGGATPRTARSRATAAVLALAVVVTGPLAALPPRDIDTVMVLFKPGTTAAEAFAAIVAMDGRVVWHDNSGGVWAAYFDDPAQARRLYRHGALLVSNSFLAAGCFGWSRPEAVNGGAGTLS